jgi:fructoselysine/glucoselysine PTS system EIIA component
MRKFLIASHGQFAGGIKSALEIIIGQTDHLFSIEAYIDGKKSIEDELNKILEGVHIDDELIVFTDLLGGSITNQVIRFALRENVYILSGMNLPLLIEVIMGDPETPISELIETSIHNAKDQIVFVNKLMNNQIEDSEDD